MRRLSSIVICTRITENGIIEVLMQLKRRDNAWEFIGGKLDGFETSVDCAKREVLEEIGLDIEYLFQEGYLDLGDKFGGCIFHAPIHLIKKPYPMIREPNKHSALGWFPIGKLPSNKTECACIVIQSGIVAQTMKYYGNMYASE